MAEIWFLFFPAVGNAENGEVNNVGEYGNYWSASLGSKNVNNAHKLNFNNGNCEVNNNNRYYGYAVRPIKNTDDGDGDGY